MLFIQFFLLQFPTFTFSHSQNCCYHSEVTIFYLFTKIYECNECTIRAFFAQKKKHVCAAKHLIESTSIFFFLKFIERFTENDLIMNKNNSRIGYVNQMKCPDLKRDDRKTAMIQLIL